MPTNPLRAAILDLDGVLTQTARLHAEAWKQMFDEFLEQRSGRSPTESAPFDIQTDYLRYVDGRPREEGVRSFLESRGIRLPQGRVDDQADAETVWGLGHRKNRRFRELLERRGVTVYPRAVAQVHRWRAQHWKTALVTSSRNGRAVVAAAELTDLFDALLDGEDAAQLGLRGKPAPDLFLAAARQLQVDPAEALIVEDAQAGVQAGRDGRFGLVVGVARTQDPEQLRRAGADLVVSELDELQTVSAARRS